MMTQNQAIRLLDAEHDADRTNFYQGTPPWLNATLAGEWLLDEQSVNEHDAYTFSLAWVEYREKV